MSWRRMTPLELVAVVTAMAHAIAHLAHLLRRKLLR